MEKFGGEPLRVGFEGGELSMELGLLMDGLGNASSMDCKNILMSCRKVELSSVRAGSSGDSGSGVLPAVHKLSRVAMLVPQNLGVLVLCLGSINGGDGGAF